MICGRRAVCDDLELTHPRMGEAGNAAHPLGLGNRWQYQGRDEHGETLLRSKDRVVQQQDNPSYLACPRYTTNRAESALQQHPCRVRPVSASSSSVRPTVTDLADRGRPGRRCGHALGTVM